jgi:hypothetical protein
MPHVTPEDIRLVEQANAALTAAANMADTTWEQRDLEEALRQMARSAELLQIMTSRAARRLPPGDQRHGTLSESLHGAVEQLGLAMLDLGHVSETLHTRHLDSVYRPATEAL